MANTVWRCLLVLQVTRSVTHTTATSAQQQTEADSGCWPDTSCTNGYCPAGSLSCMCYPGWAGFHCEEPCPADCLQDGVCQSTPEGKAYCWCNRGYVYVNGSGCIQDATTPETAATGEDARTGESLLFTTLQPSKGGNGLPSVDSIKDVPLSQRTCLPGFVCQHGRCDRDTVTCECDPGWGGVFCSDPCPKPCGEHGKCEAYPDGSVYCLCDPLYAGEFCQKLLHITTSNDTLTPVTSASFPGSSVTTSVQDSISQPEQCLSGFPCFHGTCKALPNIECLCDKGWEGVFCQNRCPLECGPHGRCQRVAGEDSAMFCNCAYGYQGDICDRKTNNYTQDGVTRLATSTGRSPAGKVNLRALSERVCAVGFVCMHGHCSTQGIECVCDPGYVGVFCHELCPVSCVHGECLLSADKTAYCSCDAQYTGANCTEIRRVPPGEPEVTWYWYVGGACAGLLLVLVVLLVVLPYYMWKRGHIFIMKIIYHFQSYEDDDDKMFDAFVSYRSSDSDEHFVLTQLFPKLEQDLNFRLCVHFRDFIPGETIANNIIRAVENSRRTILVLTPEFIQSDFCRFEYQRAQLEMLKRKQRIIPLVFRDICREKKNMDETLRGILDTITYLDWPQDGDAKKIEKFWKRLELSMPKKKSVGAECSVGTRSTTASTTSSPAFSNVGCLSRPAVNGRWPNRPAVFNPLSLLISSDVRECQDRSVKPRNCV